MKLILRRSFAFSIDLFILGFVGFDLAFFFSDYFYKIGNWGVLIGFPIAFVYFVFCSSSHFCNGQTIGKKLLKIKVVDLNNQIISPKAAMLRYLVLLVPYFASVPDLSFILLLRYKILMVLVAMPTLFWMVIVYFSLFNAKTKRSIHDYVAHTVVVPVHSNEMIHSTPIWKGHYIVITLFLLIFIAANVYISTFYDDDSMFSDFIEISKKIETVDTVKHVSQITNARNLSISGGGIRNSFSMIKVAAFVDELPGPLDDKIYTQIADIIISNLKIINSIDYIQIFIIKKYNIGIYSSSTSYQNTATILQWKDIISGKKDSGTTSKGMHFNF